MLIHARDEKGRKLYVVKDQVFQPLMVEAVDDPPMDTVEDPTPKDLPVFSAKPSKKKKKEG